MADRQAAHLVHARPLCPAGQVAIPHNVFVRKGRPQQASSGLPSSSLTPDTAPTTTTPCQSEVGYWYCHEVEDEWGIGEVGLFAGLGTYTPSVNPNDPGAHSIGQIWGLGGGAGEPSTLETGWSVSPGQWGDDNAHLFVFHTGDDYGADSCYDGCGFVGIPGSPITAGQAIAGGGGDGGWGVLLDGGYWFFYYGGYYYGYIPEYDASWEGHPITSITEAEAGGEVSSVSSCPYTQMGSGVLGNRPGSAPVSFVVLVSPSGQENYLVPTQYYTDTPSGYDYDIGGRNPSIGAFTYGGPGCAG